MNIDLLKKLTRLANNNPNENEANLAARKVCKMLEADNWNLNNNQQSLPKTPPYQGSPIWNPTKQQEDFLKDFMSGKFTWERFDYGDSKSYTKSYTPYNPSDNPKASSSAWDKDKAPIKVCERCKKEYKSPGNINVCAECQWKEVYSE